ncbi:hypothetical protein [Virgibacillus doumboii]|uniref:hypothetical protein n=1 Tax=Virgibacillus doumboii TaxID=2697503 RepID=UPI0013DEFC0F|nr:hypothetical protein [Virgibacillus doumboii]
MKKLFILVICAAFLAACGAEDASEGSADEESAESSAIQFSNIDVKVNENNIRVTGEAQAADDTFYYKLEQGESVLVEESKVKLKKKAHGGISFEIKLERNFEASDSEDVPVLTLYDKNGDGEIVNENYVPIDLAKQPAESE